MKMLRKGFERLYLNLMSRSGFTKFNNLVLKLALRARGYNNFRTLEESGERFFIDTILMPTAPKLCVDVGANVGDFSEELLRSTQAEVIAFEPLSLCHERLLTLQRNYPERLTIVKAAVGNSIGKHTIHFEQDATAHASLSEDVKQVAYVKNTASEEIDVTKLDHYFGSAAQREIDFLKIDTEGFEFEVLQGSKLLIEKNPPKFVQIEFNWHQLFRGQSLLTLAKLLPRYEVFQLGRGRLLRRDASDPLSNIYLFSNFVFIRQDIAATLPHLPTR